MDLLLIVKLLVLAYICISPFLSHKALLPFASTPIKIIFLVIIIAVSFIDLHLAILLMVAFLVMIINLNKYELDRLQTTKPSRYPNSTMQEHNWQVKEHMARGQTIYPQPSDTIQPLIDASRQNLMTPEEFSQPVSSLQGSKLPQTMYDFPAPYCKGVGPTDPYSISDNLFLYSTDDRTKAYEEYIRVLSPSSSLEKIQNNHI